MKKIGLILGMLGLLFIHFEVKAQNDDPILESYIKQGLESNMVVQQKNLSLENALFALKEARNLYIPSVDFSGLYTTAQGGRSYEIPIGDFINPIFNTVNDLIGDNLLPEIQNEKINFLPKNYYDAKVRVSVPILNMDIIHNNHIQQKQLAIKGNELEIYKRELVKEIKTTYYNYLSAIQVVDIHQNAIDLAEESRRTNEKLVEAGIGLHAYVLRSETEIESYNAKKREMEWKAASLKRYFNALLNRAVDAEIKTVTDISIIPFLNDISASADNREELASLDQAIGLREDVVKMKKQVFVPKLGGFLDLGSQAEEMRFNREALYYMVGLQLDIPIFHGNRNSLKVKQAKNEIEIARLQREDVYRKLDVAVNASHNEVLIAQSNYHAALKQLTMAETYHRLISKGYDAGVNTYIETIDSRTQLSSAELAANVGYYKLLIALANLERETASYPLETND